MGSMGASTMAQEASPTNEVNEPTPNNDKVINESNDNESNKEKQVITTTTTTNKSKGNDDNKNIHVPKDKKLKIDYVSVKNAFVESDIVFYDIHVKTSQHYWHVTKRYSQFEDLHNKNCHFYPQNITNGLLITQSRHLLKRDVLCSI